MTVQTHQLRGKPYVLLPEKDFRKVMTRLASYDAEERRDSAIVRKRLNSRRPLIPLATIKLSLACKYGLHEALIECDRSRDDPLVAEVRRTREELAERFNYDLRTICAEMRQRTEGAALAGQRVVSSSRAPAQGLDGTEKRAG